MPAPRTYADWEQLHQQQVAAQRAADERWHSGHRAAIRDALPLPLASEVGLRRAVPALDLVLGGSGFDLPDELKADPLVQAARAVWAPHLHRYTFWDRVLTLPPPEQVSIVSQALVAHEQRDLWAARRRVEKTRESRRRHRAWSQLAAVAVPQAVDVADRAAAGVNLALSQGAFVPIEPKRSAASWR